MLTIAIAIWALVAAMTGVLGLDLVHHNWAWATWDAILIACNLRVAKYCWRRHLRSYQTKGRG